MELQSSSIKDEFQNMFNKSDITVPSLSHCFREITLQIAIETKATVSEINSPLI